MPTFPLGDTKKQPQPHSDNAYAVLLSKRPFLKQAFKIKINHLMNYGDDHILIPIRF